MATVRPSGKPIPIDARPAWKPAGIRKPAEERQPFIPANYILNRPLWPGAKLAKSTPNLYDENESTLCKATSMPDNIHIAHQAKTPVMSNASSVSSIPRSYQPPDEFLPEQEYMTMSPITSPLPSSERFTSLVRSSPLPPYAVDPETNYGTEYKDQYFSKKTPGTPATRYGSLPPYAMDSYDPFADQRPQYATVGDSWEGNHAVSPASSGPPFAVFPNEANEECKTKHQKSPTRSRSPSVSRSETPEERFQTQRPEREQPAVNSVCAGVSSGPIQRPGECAEPSPEWSPSAEEQAPSYQSQTPVQRAGKPTGHIQIPVEYWPQANLEQNSTHAGPTVNEDRRPTENKALSSQKPNAEESFHPCTNEDFNQPENGYQAPTYPQAEGVHIISHEDAYRPPPTDYLDGEGDLEEPMNTFPSLDSSTGAFPYAQKEPTQQQNYDEDYMSDDSIDSAEREKAKFQTTIDATSKENEIVPETKAANLMSNPPGRFGQEIDGYQTDGSNLMSNPPGRFGQEIDGYQSDGSNMSDDSIDGGKQSHTSPRNQDSRDTYTHSLHEPSDQEPDNRKRVSWHCPEETKEVPYDETEDSGLYSKESSQCLETPPSMKTDTFFAAPSKLQDSGGGGMSGTSANVAFTISMDENPVPSKFARRKMAPLKPKLCDKKIEDGLVFGHHLDSDDSIDGRSSRASSRGSSRRSLSRGSSRDSLLSKGSSNRDNLTSASSKESLNKTPPKREYLKRKEKPRYLKRAALANKKAPVKKAQLKPNNKINNRLSGSTGNLLEPKSSLRNSKKISSSLTDISCQTDVGRKNEIGIQADPDDILAAFRAMKQFQDSDSGPSMKELSEKKKESEQLKREKSKPVECMDPLLFRDGYSDSESAHSSGFYQVVGEPADGKILAKEHDISDYEEEEVEKSEPESVDEDVLNEERKMPVDIFLDFSPLDEVDPGRKSPESLVEEMCEEKKFETDEVDIMKNMEALDELDDMHTWKPIDEYLELVEEEKREPEDIDIQARVAATLDEIDNESEPESVDEEMLTQEFKKPEDVDMKEYLKAFMDEIEKEVPEEPIFSSNAPEKEIINVEELFDKLESDDEEEKRDDMDGDDTREPIRARIATTRTDDDDALIARVTQVPHRPESPRPKSAIADIEISIDFGEERHRYDDLESGSEDEGKEREVVTIDPDLTTITTENVPHIDVTLEHLGDTPTESESDAGSLTKNASYVFDDVDIGARESSEGEVSSDDEHTKCITYGSPWPTEEHRKLPKEKEFPLEDKELNLFEFDVQPLEESPTSETIIKKEPINMAEVLLKFDEAKGSPPATPAGEGLLSEDLKWAILNDMNAPDDQVSLVSHGKPEDRQQHTAPDVVRDWSRPQESKPKLWDADRDRSPLKENIVPPWAPQRRDPPKEMWTPKRETWSSVKEPDDNWIIFQPEAKSKVMENQNTTPRSKSPVPWEHGQYRTKIPDDFRKFMGDDKEMIIISKDENKLEEKPKKQTKLPSPPPEVSDREILINFAPADEEEKAAPVMKTYPDVIYGTPQAPKSKSPLNQMAKEKKRGSDSPGLERPVERKKQRRRAPVPHSYSSDSDDDYSVDTPKQSFSSGWNREKKYPGVYRGESDQSERSTTSTLDLVDEDKAKWNAVFGVTDEQEYIQSQTIQPQHTTPVEKAPAPKMREISHKPDYLHYRNSMHIDLPPNENTKYNPLEFQFDVKPMVIIDKTADKNKENLRRNQEFVINPNNLAKYDQETVPVDQLDGEPFRYELHFHNDASSIGSSDNLSDVDVVNEEDGQVDPDDYVSLHSDSTPDTYYTGAQKPTVYYVEHNGDPTAFPRIFRHPMTDMDSSMLSSESSSPTNSLRGKRLWTGVGKYSPSGARATHAMKIFVPDKV
jgi:hypothetical protein